MHSCIMAPHVKLMDVCRMGVDRLLPARACWAWPPRARVRMRWRTTRWVWHSRGPRRTRAGSHVPIELLDLRQAAGLPQHSHLHSDRRRWQRALATRPRGHWAEGVLVGGAGRGGKDRSSAWAQPRKPRLHVLHGRRGCRCCDGRRHRRRLCCCRCWWRRIRWPYGQCRVCRRARRRHQYWLEAPQLRVGFITV